MSLLKWLKREGFGTFATIDEFTGELGRRSVGALGALGMAISSVPDDLKEIAQSVSGQGICAEIVRDLRCPKGARVAALRALLQAGTGATLPKVFAGGFDLLADARIPEADRIYLVRSGLEAFLRSAPADMLNLELLRGAAAAETAKSFATDAVKEALALFPANHMASVTVRHAVFAEPLAPEIESRWVEVLAKQHRASKNAPPAAKRMGTAPEWPPVVPQSMFGLVKRAEEAPSAVVKPSGPAGPVDPSKGKLMPDLRPRAKGVPDGERFAADGVPIDTAQLRSGLEVPVSTVTPTKAVALRHMKFGEQIDLVATRGTRAIERLLASFDARVAQIGTPKAIEELTKAATLRGKDDVNQVILDDLFKFAVAEGAAASWKRAIRIVLEQLGPDRAAALPPEPVAPPMRSIQPKAQAVREG